MLVIMDKTVLKAVDQTVSYLLGARFYKATKFLSERLVVKATRRRYGGKIVKNGSVDIVLTIGRPNYEEREFVKKCKKAGEPLPVKKVQLKSTS
jgi:hypothetical protein